MGLVTAFWSLMMVGGGETVVQTVGETRFVVDCRVNPAALVGHVKTTSASERNIVSSGGGGLANDRPNTVPAAELPPPGVVPYSVSPDKINPACGLAPSPGGPMNLYKFVKSPMVLSANTVPMPGEMPP